MRIIGGTHRSRVITFPARPGLRPTPDRVRETLFNWLGQDLTGRVCLDLFAGSGALGFEAASRGARCVVLRERDAAAARALAANARQLGLDRVEIAQGDGLDFLRSDARLFDVVFLDPPFAETDYPALLARLAGHLAADARIHVEAPQPVAVPPGLELLRHVRAGGVHAHLFGVAP
ncbi:MAG: 16S rRNA (guanine(966)-N(2))-methyltransferase RsmD [Burkholderiales bacterium]|nr:16S rRNA (guanine(966)-N(2))-methyltransferase RsmD [Burkholderiales bacterium]